MGRRIRLLIIDDNVSVREALRVTLSSKPDLDVLACSAAAPRTVIEAVRASDPDVVLVEPKSLKDKGLETCGHILAAKSSPAVVVLTSYHDEQEEMVLSELGVSRYLLKDIDSNGLYQEIIDSYTEREEAYSNSG